jgi:hypothetical protein
MSTARVWRGLFQSQDGRTLEHVAEHRDGSGGLRHQGVVLGTSAQTGPFRFDYDVLLHPSGTVRRADLAAATDDGATAVTVTADGFGHWFRQGVPLMELTGCVDLAFWCSPLALLWPLGRLKLDFGQAATLPLARVAGPSLHLNVQHVGYQSLSADAQGLRVSVTQLDQAPEAVALDMNGRLVMWAGRWRRVSA